MVHLVFNGPTVQLEIGGFDTKDHLCFSLCLLLHVIFTLPLCFVNGLLFAHALNI